MNSFKLVLFSLIAGIMLSACGAPRYFIDEDWKGKPQPKNVKVVFTMPKVVVPDDLSDDLPEYTSNFAKWFGPELKQNLITRSQDGVHYSMKLIQPNEVTYKRRDLADKDFMDVIKILGSVSEVYLVVTNTWIGREQEVRYVTTANGMMMATTYSYFTMKCTYAFYDAKTKKNLGYGYARGRNSYMFAVTRSDWETALRYMVEDFAKEAPLFAR